MSERRPGPLRRFLVGTWRVLDFSRRFILTVLFLVLVGIIVSAWLKPGLSVDSRTALVIAPVGFIVEDYTSSATDRALARLTGEEVSEVRLRDLLDALEQAGSDDRIERVLLRLDQLQGAGMASLREIAEAIDGVRAGGKEVIAYGDWYGQDGYFLAARASEVYLHPSGLALLEGFGRYRTYFAEALAKLGIEVRLFRVGEYKSAGEPYIRSDMSPEAREASLYWMGDIWQRYLQEVGAARELDPATLQAAIDGFPATLQAAGGDFAKVALDVGLVDGLKTLDELRELMVAKGVPDSDNHTFRQVHMDDLLTLRQRERTGQRLAPAPVAVVVAQGPIAEGDAGGGGVGGESTSAMLRQAREDEDVKAVVLRVDSPGGLVFPSEQIRREVELTRRAGKPVVVSMGDVAASGGYWISMDADTIYADASTITGSIGVFGLWFNAPETMDKLGLNTDGVATTELAGIFDPTRPYDPRVGQIVQASVDHSYREFIRKVAGAREMAPTAVDQVARGRVWSGAQAKDRGLVDELGGVGAAIAKARSLAGLDDDAAFAYIERELSTFERFMENLSRSALAHYAGQVGIGLPQSWLPEQVQADLKAARALFRASGNRPWGVYVHCQCGW